MLEASSLAVGEEQNSAVFPGMDNRGMIGRCEFRSTPRLGERHLILGGGSLTGPCRAGSCSFRRTLSLGTASAVKTQVDDRSYRSLRRESRSAMRLAASQEEIGVVKVRLGKQGGEGTQSTRPEERRAKQFRKRFKAREATLLAKQAGEQPVESLKEAKERFWQRTGKL